MKRREMHFALRRDFRDWVIRNEDGTLTVWYGDPWKRRVYFELTRADARLLVKRITQALEEK